MTGWSQEEIGLGNRQRVLSEILGAGTISRTQIAERLNLNAASVSRITRDLIDARLVQEADASKPEARRGPRSKKLMVENSGGFVIGIGINAFQQMVTLADLSNNRIASWDAGQVDPADAQEFLKVCCRHAEELIGEHVLDRSRLFGVGVTIAGDLDKARGTVVSAPTLGWLEEVNVCEIVGRELNVPVVLETPSAAICHSEVAFGVARDIENVVTIYCSLGFGVGFQLNGSEYSGVSRTGGLLTEARVTDGVASNVPVSLSDLCGGTALLRQILSPSDFVSLSDRERARKIWEIVSLADKGDEKCKAVLEEFGARAASCFSLTLTVLQPEMVLLAGPLAQSPYYFDAFCSQIDILKADLQQSVKIQRSEMTQMGAARLLSLSENIANAKLDLNALKGGK
ncbi:ROK family transcriptional regulator [Ruegeria sp. Ofav3-42]|uniref:ROK family transcriptional regulator n=1 Tax=Ruegeria sp. Ofav3-42 TaxID=2917759 RepID=UPI001EF4C904|nr:ROK family transcriptional regulator [Ruegeria sp. Ofav3-42]MCG7520770.1 ROK family transcriptional regulator [Ruegeria sp. Ofav3-42]